MTQALQTGFRIHTRSILTKAALHGQRRGALRVMAAIAFALPIPVFAQPPVPCIDTKVTLAASQLMDIEPVGAKAGESLAARGTLTAWHPETRTVEFRSPVSPAPESIPVKSVRFSVEQPSMVAQVPQPTLTRHGALSASFRPSEIKIVDGVIRFPKCASEMKGHRLVFEGTLTFTADAAVLKGEVLDVEMPKGSEDADPTKRKGG